MQHQIDKYINTIKQNPLLKNLLYALALFLIFVIFVLFLLRLYTHHNKAIAVPDFSDIPIEEAARLIKERNLRYEVFDSIYLATKDKGVIVDQHPKAGFLVKKNRKIYFTINANLPEEIFMPNLVGITLREASAKLASSGLKIGTLTYRFDMARNVVLEQRVDDKIITKDDKVLKGTEIDLVLGKGLGDEKARVPKLIGLTIDEAKLKAAEGSFSIGAIIDDDEEIENTTTEKVVYRQRPVSNSQILIPLGTSIDLWVTTDVTKHSGDDNSPDGGDFNSQEQNDNDAEEDSYTDDFH